MARLKTILLIFLAFQAFRLSAQDDSVILPVYHDKYSETVRQLEAGNTQIDYRAFRDNFLASRQFQDKRELAYDSLKKQVYTAIEKKEYHSVVKLTKAMLGIDYTSLFAHKYLQQTYKILGDTINRNKYHDIEFGLLTSITQSGDGKTCETAWQVIQVEEEYFILNVVGASLELQRIDKSKGNTCDKMEVKTKDGEHKIYYFDINKVFGSYRLK